MRDKKIIEKKDARILYNTQKGLISELIVAEFTEENNQQRLYQKFNFDFGNCNSNWNEWSNEQILISVFAYNNFVNDAVKGNAFNEILKIKEISEKVRPMSHRLFMD